MLYVKRACSSRSEALMIAAEPCCQMSSSGFVVLTYFVLMLYSVLTVTIICLHRKVQSFNTGVGVASCASQCTFFCKFTCQKCVAASNKWPSNAKRSAAQQSYSHFAFASMIMSSILLPGNSRPQWGRIRRQGIKSDSPKSRTGFYPRVLKAARSGCRILGVTPALSCPQRPGQDQANDQMETKPTATRMRSSTGCWTCRLRRKKCDESKPSCHRCEKLSISCDGYGARPSWMDGNCQEKLRAQQTKRAIRRKTPIWTSASAPSASEAHNSASSHERGLSSLTDYPEVKTQVQSGHECMPSVAKPGTLEERSAIASYELLTASNKGPEPKPLTTAESDGGDDIWSCITTVPNTVDEDAEFVSTLPELDELYLTAATATASTINAFVGQATVATDYFSRSSTVSSVSGNHDQFGLRPTLKEADLLLFYFDNMQFLQLPFASSREHRSWQFFLISRSAVCYWATLSLSAYGLRQG